MLASLIRPTERPMLDRTHTVGASEIGQCSRQTWFRKQGVVEERDTGWGFGERGHVVEAWAVDRLRAAGVPIEHVQRRVVRGFLSATVDFVLNGEPVDIKSFDPRKTRVPEPKNYLQSQVQSGLLDAPRGHLLAINASDYSDIREVAVDHDPALFTSLQTRAREIMTGPMPVPEGRIAGGDECEWCPFWSACLGPPVDGRGHLKDEERTKLEELADEVRAAKAEAKVIDARIAKSREQIRAILRAADVRKVPGLVRIHRTARTQLDTEALEAAGIDLTPYRRPGRVSEVVTVNGTED
jgi:hypothetical protein